MENINTDQREFDRSVSLVAEAIAKALIDSNESPLAMLSAMINLINTIIETAKDIKDTDSRRNAIGVCLKSASVITKCALNTALSSGLEDIDTLIAKEMDMSVIMVDGETL